MSILGEIIYGYDLSTESNLKYLDENQLEVIKNLKKESYINGLETKYHGYLDFVGYFGVSLKKINTSRNFLLSEISNVSPTEKDIEKFNSLFEYEDEEIVAFLKTLGEPQVFIIWYTT